MKSNGWNEISKAKLNDKEYTFKTKGVFNKVVLIIDPSTQETVGNINFTGFSTKAKINLRTEENATLFVRNFWQTKWRLSSESSYRIDYQGRLNKGQISYSSNTSIPEIFILSGVFATNRIWEHSAMIAFIIIILIAI